MNRLLIGIVSLLALCKVAVLQAQSPRLVVLISVEELRSDLLEELQDDLSDNGLKLLLKSGQRYTHVEAPILYSNVTATEAIIHTGTLAFKNNISERKPVRIEQTGRRVYTNSVFEDKNYLGYATTGNYSPKALGCSTLSDNLKKATNQRALVYSIAPNAEEAIIGGGLYGDGAFWIDSFTGRWASSTYYKGDFPWYVDKANVGETSLPYRLERGITWQYSGRDIPFLSRLNDTSYLHDFRKAGSGISDFKDSPLVNEEVLRLAKRVLDYSGIGKDDIPDLLSLHLTLANGNRTASDVTAETIDSYFRLDRNVAELLSYLDLKSTLVVLSGNGFSREYPSVAIDDRRLFRVDRCLALINMYLNAQFGVQGLVEEVTPDGAVYLNHGAIEGKSHFSKEDIEHAVSRFLLEFRGVSYAIESCKLREEALANADSREWQTALNKYTNTNRPDVVFGLLPSWVAQDLSNERGVVSYRLSAIPTTLLLLHPSLKAETITTPLDLRNVSKVIAWSLRIRPPTP